MSRLAEGPGRPRKRQPQSRNPARHKRGGGNSGDRMPPVFRAAFRAGVTNNTHALKGETQAAALGPGDWPFCGFTGQRHNRAWISSMRAFPSVAVMPALLFVDQAADLGPLGAAGRPA